MLHTTRKFGPHTGAHKLTIASEKSKKDDEKNINQLYKDLMSGNLRKRAGRDAFDMSDSEDEADMRRRKRQREFQQMTRALVQDERIGKIGRFNLCRPVFYTDDYL